MPLNIQNVRSVALSLPGVEEKPCHGTPAFYVRGKLLARLQEHEETLSIGCPRDERAELIEQYPDVFFITEHFRNYDYVLISLTAADANLLAQMFESAWRRKAAKKEIAKFDAASSEEPQQQ